MIAFLTENLWTIVIGGILGILLLMVTLKVIKDKKDHKSSCGCGCKDCPSAEICHKK